MSQESSIEPVLDALVLGAGFAGLHALYRLRENGLKVLALEAAPDVGGAWYWNRYPGARCDVESLVYCYTFSPLLDEGWQWSERYAKRDEIQAYLSWVANKLDLRRDIRFNSRVVSAVFDDRKNLWTIRTEQGDTYRARHFFSAAGPITTPIMPDIPGLKDFKGLVIHTARWPERSPDFAGKRVAIIGTGSSAVQAIPIVAEQCKQLTVLMRTPNFYAPARNRPLTAADYEWWEKNRELTRHRLQNCLRWGGGDIMLDDAINDAMFQKAGEFTPERRREIYEARYANGGGVVGWAFCDAMADPEVNEEAANFLRGKIGTIVTNPRIAEKLTPRGYAYGTKRCTVGTDFYETFNRDNVELIDIKSEPIERFTPEGVVVGGREIKLDVLISASGFDALTGALTSIDLRGTSSESLKEGWAHGPHSHLGISVHGFPNLYMVGGPGSPSVLTNVVMTNEMQVEWIAALISHCEKQGFRRCEATREAEEQWTRHVNDLVKGTLWEHANSWYVGANVPGKPRVILAYVGGYLTYRERCEQERSQGYPGFSFS
ncbi:flavin-containing monooxygenase [Steroidobacter flavus]|uniref:Flavin-containing monooxygenase n=1 Tax=Steroidobacter flavus TaxID=1842136 RepID=A0ABV8SYX2_9GAMM